MKREDYLLTLEQLHALAQIVKDMPLYEFIQAIEHANAIGPILTPTMYRQAANNLATIERLAQSLLPFKRTVKELMAKEPAK